MNSKTNTTHPPPLPSMFFYGIDPPAVPLQNTDSANTPSQRSQACASLPAFATGVRPNTTPSLSLGSTFGERKQLRDETRRTTKRDEPEICQLKPTVSHTRVTHIPLHQRQGMTGRHSDAFVQQAMPEGNRTEKTPVPSSPACEGLESEYPLSDNPEEQKPLTQTHSLQSFLAAFRMSAWSMPPSSKAAT